MSLQGRVENTNLLERYKNTHFFLITAPLNSRCSHAEKLFVLFQMDAESM